MFVMGHLIQRKKAHVVGDDLSLVTLFRCLQNMPETSPNNSCYTAGNYEKHPKFVGLDKNFTGRKEN